MMNILFEEIRIVAPTQKINGIFNVWIKDGVFKEISKGNIEIDPETKRIPSKHLTMSPGFFDMHVHLREPGQTHKETISTGTLSAANGGFTGVVCMPNTEPAIDSQPILEYVASRAKGNIVDVHCCAAITKGREGNELANLLSLHESGAVMFSDDGGCLRSAEMMRRAFEYVSHVDGLLTQHCEEHSMTDGFAMHEGRVSADLGLKGYPSVAEDIIVARDILLAEYCGNRRYHAAHLSSKGAVRLVREAKVRGLRVTCEVAPHHFVLTEEAVRGYNTNAKMNPPLRTQKDIEAMWQGLADGTVDVIATDHAPHAFVEKNVEFENAPNGIVGLETSLALALTHLYHTKIITMEKVVELLAVNPRKILNINIPLIESGTNANVTVFDAEKEWSVCVDRFKTKSKNSPFDSQPLKGKPVFVINNNQIFASEL